MKKARPAHLFQELDELFFTHLPAQLARLGHPDEDTFDLPRSLGTHKRDARHWGDRFWNVMCTGPFYWDGR